MEPDTTSSKANITFADIGDDVDIAARNLHCADGLPGAEDLDIVRCLRTLNAWAEGVRSYTASCEPVFDSDSSQFGERRSVFLMLSMPTLLKHPRGGIGIAYEPTAIGNYFFRDSKHDFLHGIIIRRRGTCASLPVLFVAIGRRLGYPIHLSLMARSSLVRTRGQ